METGFFKNFYMTLMELLILLIIAAICGSIGQAIAGFDLGGCLVQEQGRPRSVDAVLGDVLTLRGRGVTNVGLALRGARRQLGRSGARERVAVLLSDAMATEGDDPLTALRGIDRLHVLGTSDEPISLDAGRLLARRGNGRHRCCTSVAEIPSAITSLLS